MGCNYSTGGISLRKTPAHIGMEPPKKESQATQTLTSINCNDTEIDISHFSLSQEAIGIGGFGIVRKVSKITEPDKGVQYAAKSMSKEAILKRTSGPNSVLTELKCLEKMTSSAYVCKIHYAFQTPSHLYMVMELATGGDLRLCLRLIPTGRFSEDAARHVISQVLIALSHCHKNSILHRDVKPENLLMTAGGTVKLSDFGVAKILPDICDCRSTSGTHGYMAPEVYMDKHQHGPAAEWFSVGITLHELLTGRRPFEASRLQAFRYVTANLAECSSLQQHSSFKFRREGQPVEPKILESAAGQLHRRIDSLWPEFLYSTQCDYLSENARKFLRALLVHECTARLGGPSCHQNGCVYGGRYGLDTIKRDPWLSDVNWTSLEGATPVIQVKSSIAQQFPTAFPQKYRLLKKQRTTQQATIVGCADCLPILPSLAPCSPLPPHSVYGSASYGREELQLALQAHLQAPAVSPVQQKIFKNYEYRNRLPDRASSVEQMNSCADRGDKSENKDFHGRKFIRVEDLAGRSDQEGSNTGDGRKSDRRKWTKLTGRIEHAKIASLPLVASKIKPRHSRYQKNEEWKDLEADQKYDGNHHEVLADFGSDFSYQASRDPFSIFSP